MTGNCPPIHHYAICTVENMPSNTQHGYLRMCLWYRKETLNLCPRGGLGVRNWPFVQKALDSSSVNLMRIVRTSNLCAYGKRRLLPWFESLNKLWVLSLGHLYHSIIGDEMEIVCSSEVHYNPADGGQDGARTTLVATIHLFSLMRTYNKE